MAGKSRRQDPAWFAAGVSIAAVLIPCLLVAATAGILAYRYQRAERGATVQAEAVVERARLGEYGEGIQVRWTDQHGNPHTQRFEVVDPAVYPQGSAYGVRYDPRHPGRAFPADTDGTYLPTDNTSLALLGACLLAPLLLAPWGVRLVAIRRSLARPGMPYQAMALIGRHKKAARLTRPFVALIPTELPLPQWGYEVGVVELPEGSRLQGVMWHPALDALEPGTRVLVHARPTQRLGAVVVLPDGTRLWPAGRLRRSVPVWWRLPPRPAFVWRQQSGSRGPGTVMVASKPRAGLWRALKVVVGRVGAIAGPAIGAATLRTAGAGAGVIVLLAVPAGMAALTAYLWGLLGGEPYR